MRGQYFESASRYCIWNLDATGSKWRQNSESGKSNSEGSNSTRIRNRLDSASPCSSAKRMFPLWRKMKSAILATTPLRSGQLTSRMAEFFITDCVVRSLRPQPNVQLYFESTVSDLSRSLVLHSLLIHPSAPLLDVFPNHTETSSE